MTPTDDDQDPNALRQRPLRMPNKTWADFDLVAAAMGTDGTSLLRDFVRYMTYDETVLPPRRPDIPIEQLRYVPLPEGISVVHDFDASSPYQGKPRFVIRVDSIWQDATNALFNAGLSKGASYRETSPVTLSTLDRAHAERMLKAIKDAGLTVL